jgi:hypothetical protein
MVVNVTLVKVFFFFFFFFSLDGLTSYAVMGKQWKMIFPESSLVDTGTSNIT